MKNTRLNPIIHETLPLKTLIRSPWNTVGQYTCAVKNTNKMSARITSYASHAGCKLQLERYTAVNVRTGKTMAIIQAIVTKRGRNKLKPGPKVGKPYSESNQYAHLGQETT